MANFAPRRPNRPTSIQLWSDDSGHLVRLAFSREGDVYRAEITPAMAAVRVSGRIANLPILVSTKGSWSRRSRGGRFRVFPGMGRVVVTGSGGGVWAGPLDPGAAIDLGQGDLRAMGQVEVVVRDVSGNPIDGFVARASVREGELRGFRATKATVRGMARLDVPRGTPLRLSVSSGLDDVYARLAIQEGYSGELVLDEPERRIEIVLRPNPKLRPRLVR